MCIQKYLREGFKKQNLVNYQKKNLINIIEGKDGNGDVFNWMEDWVSTTRLDNNFNSIGLPSDQLYRDFIKDNFTLMSSWSSKRFLDSFFDYISSRQDLEWNPLQSKNGSTRSSRRVKLGSRDNQKDTIFIVTKSVEKNDFLKVA